MMLRKLILKSAGAFCIGMTLCSGSAFAQHRLEFGVAYMVQKSVLVNKNDNAAAAEIDPTSTMDYMSGGLTAAYRISPFLAVEVDVLRSRQGQFYKGNSMITPDDRLYNHQLAQQAMLNGDLTLGDFKARAELNCIKVPILLRFSSDSRKPLSFTLSAGPQINSIYDAVYEIEGEDVSFPGTDVTSNDMYHKVTVDGVLAVGVRYNICKHFTLSAQARGDYGFQDVEKKDATYSYQGLPRQRYYSADRAATHNGTAALMFGICYKL